MTPFSLIFLRETVLNAQFLCCNMIEVKLGMSTYADLDAIEMLMNMH